MITAMNSARTAATVRKRAEPMKMEATRRRSGFGGVMPKVMMKASAMDSRNFMGAPISIVGNLGGGSREGTKVTLPMGSTGGSKLGVSTGVRATETNPASNELSIRFRVR